MAKTENYGFELPNPSGIQLTEIDKIAQAIIAIDLELKAASTALTQHTHAFGNITDLPNTLAGYGIQDAMTANQVEEAISVAVSGLLGSDAPEALDTLSKLAAAVGGNSKFSTDVTTALDIRVSVDAAQGFTQAQKTQGRSNLDALGAVDKGKANGVAPLDANKKVPEANLPALTTTATVGAATAAAASKQTPADSDFFSGVLAGGSTMFKTTWGNIKATLKSYFDGLYLGLGGGTVTGDLTAARNLLLTGHLLITSQFRILGDANANYLQSGASTAQGSFKPLRITTYQSATPLVEFNLNWTEFSKDIRFGGKITDLAGGGLLHNNGFLEGSYWEGFGDRNARACIWKRIEERGAAYRDSAISSAMPKPYTGTNVNETNLPVGHPIFCTVPNSRPDKNNATSPRLGGSKIYDNASNSGTLLAGTWRSRGIYQNSIRTMDGSSMEIYLMLAQRIS